MAVSYLPAEIILKAVRSVLFRTFFSAVRAIKYVTQLHKEMI